MFRKLRTQLILSHILPLVIIVPLVGIGLTYLLETRVLLPRMAKTLVSDARLLSEITRTEYELWGDPFLFQSMLSRVQLDPSLKVMFLTPDGSLLYSTEPKDNQYYGEVVPLSGIPIARSGSEVVFTNFKNMRSKNVLIDVLSPVTSMDGPLIGIVRVTYSIDSVADLFAQMRSLIILVLAGALLLGGAIGFILAWSINRPIQSVTSAIYDIAHGNRSTPLVEQGPEEIRDQARAVNYLVERLKNLEQTRKQLLANLVHELGRPLGALRSAIHALSLGAADDPQLFHDLTTGMDEQATRLGNVLEELTHLHGQFLGSLELNLVQVSLNEWLTHTLAPWKTAAADKKIEWKENYSADLPVIQADPIRLEQMVGNLVDNAIKYTAPGGQVTIESGEDNREIYIRVIDTGIGIPIEEQSKIFNPFFRGDQGKRIKQGMGLGLSIANELAIAHNGRIELVSAPHQGSTFTLWLPAS